MRVQTADKNIIILFHCRETLLWITNLYFDQKQRFKVKTSWWICFLQTRSFWLHKMLTDGLEWCGLLVDYCDVFISCLDSHSDGTHSLQRIHWWASDATFLQICSDKNKLIYILDEGESVFSKLSFLGELWFLPITTLFGTCNHAGQTNHFM